jgi:hypothetical protein
MKEELADELLAEVMGWDSEEVSKNRPVLQALAKSKYDKYQQFQPGMKFIESLAIWLNQFDKQSHKKAAYEFVLNNLVFISRTQMRHLVSLAYPEKVRAELIQQTANKEGVSQLKIQEIVDTDTYKYLRRRSLFLGLSDGAHAPAFRRANTGRISHEQIVPYYQFNEEKSMDLEEELEKSLDELGHNSPEDEKFSNIFLLDDFTASGKSYFREENGEYDGKIYRVIDDLRKEDSPLSKIIDRENLSIFVLIYVASEYSFDRLKNELGEWAEESECSFSIKPLTLQKLPKKNRSE